MSDNLNTPTNAAAKTVHRLLTDDGLSQPQMLEMLGTLDPDTLSAEDIAACARAMMAASRPFSHIEDAIDTCGTGGDGAHTRNVSTACAFVLAASGATVVKHGNRSVSSKSGSADVLQALGINLSPSADKLTEAIKQANLAFLFAPDFHPALGRLRQVRKDLGKRSVFNVLGPLCNPARVKRQLVGVYDLALLPKMAEALKLLGCESAMVVCAEDGLDECSISAPTHVMQLKDGTLNGFTLTPDMAGLALAPADAIKGGNAEENAAALIEIFNGAENAYRDAVCLNAAAALIVNGQASNWQEAAHIAGHVLTEHKALHVLNHYRNVTQVPV